VANARAGEERRHTLLRAALEGAIARLDSAGSDATKAFAAIGEVAFWVVAADESVRTGTSADQQWREAPERLRLFQGMRYPRNGTAHESTAWEQAYQDPYTERFWSEYGAWVWSPLPEPGPADERRVKQYEAYQERLQGRRVLDTAADAKDELISWWDTRKTE
jgi:hypothetical protein